MADSSPKSFRSSGDSSRNPQRDETKEAQSQPAWGRASLHRRSHSLEPLNENSPLLSPVRTDDIENVIQNETSGTPGNFLELNDTDEEPSKSILYLFLLTLGIGG